MAQLFDFGPYYGDSAQWYSAMRRRRVRDMHYGALEEQIGAVAGAETAAFSGSGGASRTIMIGVATGVFTYLLTRVADKLLFGGKRLGQRRRR